jgi:hypothetical protein
MTTKQKLTAAAKQAKNRLIAAADAALVAQGKAARVRQRRLKTVAKTIAIAGTATAAVLGARATARAVRQRAAVTT